MMFAGLYGCYNARDWADRLLPWTVRSRSELIALVRASMGECPSLLPGVFSQHTGDDFPQIDWNGIQPHDALAELYRG